MPKDRVGMTWVSHFKEELKCFSRGVTVLNEWLCLQC